MEITGPKGQTGARGQKGQLGYTGYNGEIGVQGEKGSSGFRIEAKVWGGEGDGRTRYSCTQSTQERVQGRVRACNVAP